ncbi:MAG: hypothetical protein KatS3mg014_2572 [Actinomycetota bacterium]|nr:MAG: hypothetical protein KatS3mg014_2572 [Actinomycetota bacterium]
MSKHPRPHEVAEGDLLVVEASSAEEALEAVTERLGPDARIVRAERVRRGGVAGFFAREMVQLTAARAADAAALARLGARAARGAARGSFEERLEAALDAPDGPAVEVASPPAVEVASPEADAPGAAIGSTDRAVAGLGSVAWSPDELVRLGLPYGLIEAVVRLSPRDDLGWVAAIAGWAARHCPPLPDGPALVIGPHADRLARALDLPLVRCPELPRNGGTVCVVSEEGCADLAWLAKAQAGRFVHAVLGGSGSGRLREWHPKVVSWVEPEELAEALRWCAQDGAILGYGVLGGRIVRANPVDVALAVREGVVRR